MQVGDRQYKVYGLAILAWVEAVRRKTARAGRLWGAVEAEESRGPLGQWEAERERYANLVHEHADPDFEQAREAGRRLTLEQAVDYALTVNEA